MVTTCGIFGSLCSCSDQQFGSVKQKELAAAATTGPKGWPLLGSIGHLCGKDRNSFLSRMVEKYGAIFTLSLGSRKVVVVNSHDIMRKILLDGHVLSERAPIESLDSYFQGRGKSYLYTKCQLVNNHIMLIRK